MARLFRNCNDALSLKRLRLGGANESSALNCSKRRSTRRFGCLESTCLGKFRGRVFTALSG